MKDFLIVAPKSALTYNNVFPLIKNRKLWTGITFPKEFILRNGNSTDALNGLTRWFGNIQYINTLGVHPKDTLTLTKSYYENPSYYPKYDNYDAINVDKIKDIPYDYNDPMGVPITFLDGYHPDFVLIDARDIANDDKLKHKETLLIKDDDGIIGGVKKYVRVVIKKSDYQIVGVTEERGKGFSNGLKKNTADENMPIIDGQYRFTRVFVQKQPGQSGQPEAPADNKNLNADTDDQE